MVDLWPDDIGVPIELKAPVTILKEQASLLGKKTQNLVEAKVEQVSIAERRRITRKGRHEEFGYRFFLVASALGGYSYKLFEVTHGIELYPVNIYPGTELYEQIRDAGQVESLIGTKDRAMFVAISEDELLEILRHIFASEKTRQIIAALLAQAGVGEEE